MRRLCLLPLLLFLPHVYSRNIWSVYKSCLSNRPLLTKSTTSAVIMSISDVLCQKLEQSIYVDIHHHASQQLRVAINNENSKSSRQLDWHRTRQVAITGFTWSGPISHTWYAILEYLVTIKDKLIGWIIRMLMDAFIFSPVAVAGYFIWRTILEGGRSKDIVAKLRDSYVNALLASFRFWPCANIINFSLVPLEYRVLYNNMLSLFWNGYLSHMNSMAKNHIEDERMS